MKDLNKTMVKTVLEYPKLAHLLEDREKDLPTVYQYLREIAADYSPIWIKIFSSILDFFFGRIYQAINFKIDPKVNFTELLSKKNIVVVSNHQSHADYMIINFLIFKNFKVPLFVAGGLNLNIFPIGKLFRKSGCFFIRRNFSGNILYKLTFEAYIYYLLKEGHPIEFFFEGGRTRSGKLMFPRLGVYQMLIEAHSYIEKENRRELVFLPVTIIHEYVPEQKTISSEFLGKKKERESFWQLLKIFKIFAYKMGNVYVNLNCPVPSKFKGDLKDITKKVALTCFEVVGKNLSLTPASLLAMIMLDEPTGVMQWQDIVIRAEKILEFCDHFEIPYVDSLSKGNVKANLDRCLNNLILNNKVQQVGSERYGRIFYFIKKDCRHELLFLKNTILHHFFVPWLINLAWINVFKGNITNSIDLKNFYNRQRAILDSEFYFPTLKKSLKLAMKIISYFTNTKFVTPSECLNVTYRNLYALASNLGIFARGCSHIYECHYIVAVSIKALTMGRVRVFNEKDLYLDAKDIFDVEIEHGRVIKYEESLSHPLVINTLKYFTSVEILDMFGHGYTLIGREKLDNIINEYTEDLKDQLSFNLKT